MKFSSEKVNKKNQLFLDFFLKYNFCAPIFHPISETESEYKITWATFVLNFENCVSCCCPHTRHTANTFSNYWAKISETHMRLSFAKPLSTKAFWLLICLKTIKKNPYKKLNVKKVANPKKGNKTLPKMFLKNPPQKTWKFWKYCFFLCFFFFI